MDQPSRNKLFMNERTKLEVGLFVGIILLAVASRFWLIDYPNFKPVAALALFGGLLFRKLWVGMGAILVAMMTSNIAIGGYEWQIAWTVYLSLALAVMLGASMRKHLDPRATGAIPTCKRGLAFAAASLVTATTFFLLTNLATWYCWYPLNVNGLAACFSAAIPFFRWTLAGDMTFVAVFAVAYELGIRWAYAERAEPVAFESR